MSKVEKQIELILKREKEIYILSEYDKYHERFKIVGCFTNSHKVHKEAEKIMEYSEFTESEIFNLVPGESLQTDGYNTCIKIEKFLLN